MAEIYLSQCPYDVAGRNRLLCAGSLSWQPLRSVEAKHVLYGLMGTLIMVSCKPALEVSANYDKTVDFSSYRTFGVVGTESLVRSLNQLNYERVLIAVRNEMTKRGFVEAAVTPDVIVKVVAKVDSKATISSTSYYQYGSVDRPYTWGPGVSYTDYDVRHYKNGTLIIDVVDADAQRLLWQGVGKKEIDTPSKHPEKDIPKGVELIMAGFPPGNKKISNQ